MANFQWQQQQHPLQPNLMNGIKPQHAPDIHQLPTFTVEDEHREISSLTPHEILSVESDLIGTSSHNTDLIKIRRLSGRDHVDLNLLQQALDRIPPADKGSYLHACSTPTCRDEALGRNAMGRNRHMAFMERYGFDATVAARKIVQYWEERLGLFGMQRA